MPVKIAYDAPSVPVEGRAAFAADVRVAFAVYKRLRRSLRLPASDITALLAEDFAGAVEANIAAPFRLQEGDVFTTERVAGPVVAKVLDQTGDASRVIIVFDAALWRQADNPEMRARGIHIVAHELAHPVIDRARYVSGAMDGVRLPSLTPHESLRSAARIMAGEYRADLLADFVLGSRVSLGPSGQQVPATSWQMSGDDWHANLLRILTAAHPAWADAVQAYREWHMDLLQMMTSVVSAIDQSLTGLVHAQASADAARSDVDILALPDFAALPAVRLYLAEPWADFLAALRATPVLPRLRHVSAAEEAVTSAGEAALLKVLAQLGITPFTHPDGDTWGVDVAAPLR